MRYNNQISHNPPWYKLTPNEDSLLKSSCQPHEVDPHSMDKDLERESNWPKILEMVEVVETAQSQWSLATKCIL